MLSREPVSRVVDKEKATGWIWLLPSAATADAAAAAAASQRSSKLFNLAAALLSLTVTSVLMEVATRLFGIAAGSVLKHKWTEHAIMLALKKGGFIEPLLSFFFGWLYVVLKLVWKLALALYRHARHLPASESAAPRTEYRSSTAAAAATYDSPSETSYTRKATQAGSVSSGTHGDGTASVLRTPPPALPETRLQASVADIMRDGVYAMAQQPGVKAWAVVMTVSVIYLFFTNWTLAGRDYDELHHRWCSIGTSESEQCMSVKRMSRWFMTFSYVWHKTDPIGGAFVPVWREFLYPVLTSTTLWRLVGVAAALIACAALSLVVVAVAWDALGLEKPLPMKTPKKFA